jgi:hypothetical protein
MLQAGRSRDRIPMRSLDSSIDLILPDNYGPGVDSARNRNEYQESSLRVKGGRRIRLTTLPPSVSRLPRENVGVSTSHNPKGLHALLQREHGRGNSKKLDFKSLREKTCNRRT